MSLTPEGRRLTAEQLELQIRARAAYLARMAEFLANADPQAVVDSWRVFETAMAAIIAEGGAVSGALAADYYSKYRQAEIGGRPYPARIISVPEDYVINTLRSTTLATAIKVGGRTAVGASTAGAVATEVAAPVAAGAVLTMTAGVATRLMLMAGRRTILDNADDDDEVVGYARVTTGHPCAFCAMLASRGPVYKTKGTALRNSHGARYHGHCCCGAEASYSRDADWPPGGREWREKWNKATKDASSPDEARLAFRQFVEGRES